jgi:cell division septum initiation protein DivIVA
VDDDALASDVEDEDDARRVKPLGGVTTLARFPLLNLCGGVKFLRQSAKCEDPLGEAALLVAELNAALAAATAARAAAAASSATTSAASAVTGGSNATSGAGATSAGAVVVACSRITGQVRTAVDRLTSAAAASGTDAKQVLLMSMLRVQEPYLDAARATIRRFLTRGDSTSTGTHAAASNAAAGEADGGVDATSDEEEEERRVERECQRLLQLAVQVVYYEALERARSMSLTN